MALFDNQDSPEVTVEDFFPSSMDVEAEIQKSQKYKLSLAERYAAQKDISVDEALKTVETGSAYSLFNDQVSKTDVLDTAFKTGSSVDTFNQMLETYDKNMTNLRNAGDSQDTFNQIINPLDPNSNNEEISQAIITEAFQKMAPQESWIGSAASVVGMLVRESTVGSVESALGLFQTSVGDWEGKSQTGRDTYEAIRLEPDVNKKRLIAEQAAKEAADLGLLGDNSLLYWQRYNTVMQKGKGENEELWVAADIATFAGGKAVKALATGVRGLTGTSVKLALATDGLEVAEAVGGKAAANKVMDQALSNPATAINTPKHSAPSSSSVASNGMGPTLKPVLSNEVANDYAEKVAREFEGMYSQDMLNAAKARRKAEIETKTTFHVLDIAEENIGFDSYAVKMTIGRDDGVPFSDIVSAQKFAKSVGGTVEPYGFKSGAKEPEGYVVSFKENLNMKGLAKATELGQLRQSIFDRFMSPEVTSVPEYNTILKRGLNKIGYVEQEIMNQHNKILKKVSKEDLRGLSSVINKLSIENPLDGEWYDIRTFKDIFYKQTGKQASDDVVKAYTSSYKIVDTARKLEADKVLKRFANTDTRQFMGSFDGQNFYRINKVPQGALPRTEKYAQKYIYDFDKNKVISAKEFFKGKQKKNLFQIVDTEKMPVVDGKVVPYGTGSLRSSRPLLHSDVFPKIAGGSRDISNVAGFLVNRRLVKDLSGNTLEKTPGIIFVGRTAKELADAGKELNTILKAYRSFGAGTLTKDEVTAIIKANNGFNPNIEDFKTLEDFIQKTGMDGADLESVIKESSLPEVGLGYFENYRVGKFTTYEDLYKHGDIPNKVIFGYGAGQFKHIDPLVGMERDFAKGINYIAEREYNYRSIEGFLKAGADNGLISNYKDLQNLPLVEQLKRAIILPSKEGEKLMTERRVIMNRLHETNDFAQKWERRMKGIGEYVFDKTKIDVIDKFSVRPDVALRSFAFDLKLGLFNPDQLIVQALSAINIVAIDPINGLKSAASYLPIRMAMQNTDPAFVKAVYARSKLFIGMSEKEFMESIDYLKKSGTFQVNQNLSEINSTYDVTRGMVTKARQLGRIPFNEGDRVARIMASNTAYREFRKLYPDLDVTTSSGFRIMDDFITSRADKLTMNMTRASAAGWQQGWTSIPTQWLGYSARLMENIFFGRDLTGLERTRLGLAQVAVFGAAGVPVAGYVVNALVDQSSEGIDKETYTLLRYGLYDYILSSIAGTQTSMSSRLGPGEGIMDIYENLVDKNFAEVLAGPSGAIAYDTIMPGMSLVYSMFNSDISVTKYDMNKILRNISTWNKATQDYYLIQTGEYLDRKGRVVAEGMNPWNAVWNTLGARFQEVDLQYDIRAANAAEKDMVFKVSDRVRELLNVMDQQIQNDDMTSARAISEEIQSLIAPLTPDQLKTVLGMNKGSVLNSGENVIRQDSKTVKQGLSRQLEKVMAKE